MNALKALWHDILLVWTFFRIPAPEFLAERRLSQALWALPLAGVVIGLAQYVGIALLMFSLPECLKRRVALWRW